jgi:hypothetical protein
MERILPIAAKLVLAQVNEDLLDDMELIDVSDELKNTWLEVIRVDEYKQLISTATFKVTEIKRLLEDLTLLTLHSKLRRLKEIAEMMAVLDPASSVDCIRSLQGDLSYLFVFPSTMAKTLELPKETESYLMKRIDIVKKDLEGVNEKEVVMEKAKEREAKEKERLVEKEKLRTSETTKKEVAGKDEKTQKAAAKEIEKPANKKEPVRGKDEKSDKPVQDSKLTMSAPRKPTTASPTTRPPVARISSKSIEVTVLPITAPEAKSPTVFQIPHLSSSKSDSSAKLTTPDAAESVRSKTRGWLARRQRATNLHSSTTDPDSTSLTVTNAAPAKYGAKEMERIWDEIHAEMNSPLGAYFVYSLTFFIRLRLDDSDSESDDEPLLVGAPNVSSSRKVKLAPCQVLPQVEASESMMVHASKTVVDPYSNYAPPTYVVDSPRSNKPGVFPQVYIPSAYLGTPEPMMVHASKTAVDPYSNYAPPTYAADSPRSNKPEEGRDANYLSNDLDDYAVDYAHPSYSTSESSEPNDLSVFIFFLLVCN